MSIFSQVSLKRPKYSKFNLSYDRKFSFNEGMLVPCHVQEVVPGDVFNHTSQHMLRFQPLIAPVMHEYNTFTHYYYVPNRILWDNWNEFITGGKDGLDATLFPTIKNLVTERGSLADYLGLPTIGEGDEPNPYDVSLLPFVAYQMIYNEYYRDQNLIDEIPLEIQDGSVDYANFESDDPFMELFKLRRRAWNHDYFTSALPFAQRGAPVQIPLVNTAGQYLDVEYDNEGNTLMRNADGSLGVGNGMLGHYGAYVTDYSYPDDHLHVDNSENLKVPLDSLQVNATTINDLRKATKLQAFLERAARAGARINEFIRANWGVNVPDSRVQRPEYLGGGMSPVMVSEVLQTSETANSPQGSMAGHALNLGKNHSYKHRFVEHGYVIGIMSVMPRSSYQQGIPRHFSKSDRFDYHFPDFESIGEQEIKRKELFVDGDGEDTFGYIPRYAEYKYNPSTVHGDFRGNLDFWHSGRIFDSSNPPQLNQEFIECNPTRRIYAVEDEEEHTMLCHMFHSIQAIRPMKYYSSPSL